MKKTASGKFQVVKSATGEHIGPPKTKEEAERLLRALWANVKK